MVAVYDTDWPVQPGVYVLIFDVAEPLTLPVGRLGRVDLTSGRYAYVGSARGPGGLRGRLARHLRPQKRLHWHVDYLTRCVAVGQVYWLAAAEPLECRWVQALQRLPGAAPGPAGFGSSDCRAGCRSHLIRLPEAADDETLLMLLGGPAGHAAGLGAAEPGDH